MIKLEAPYPTIQTISFLPDPTFNDSENEQISINKQYTMSGSIYTYVKTSNNRRKLTYNFELPILKSLELKAFIESYIGSKIKVTDHLDSIWIVQFTSNPFEYTTIGPQEYTTIQLELEGFKQ